MVALLQLLRPPDNKDTFAELLLDSVFWRMQN